MGLSNNKKGSLLILIALGLVAVLVGPGVFAYFSSTQTSGTNTFTAGTIDLSVNNQDPWTGTIDANLKDLKPGMNRLGTVTLKNVGTNPEDVWVMITAVSTADGATSVPETTEEAGTAVNNIDSVIRYDLTVDSNVKIADADNYLISAPGHHLTTGTAVKDKYIYLGNLAKGATMTVDQSFMMDPLTTNWAQGDTMAFTVKFYAQQSEGDTQPPAPTPELAGHARP
jgi:predicted ribosomally synthesized peptide with SipW-like signal peptide